MKSKSPAFQFYPKDWLSDPDVASWGLAERGAFITLLCYIWENDGIKNDENYIKRLLGNPRNFPKLYSKVKNKFYFDGEMIHHPRLMKEREKQRQNKVSRQKNGKLGAEIRWQNHSKAIAKNSTASSSSTATAIRGEKPYPPVKKFWMLFNNWKEDKILIIQEEPNRAERQSIVQALERMSLDAWTPFIKEMHKRGGKKPLLKWFLNGDFRKYDTSQGSDGNKEFIYACPEHSERKFSAETKNLYKVCDICHTKMMEVL